MGSLARPLEVQEFHTPPLHLRRGGQCVNAEEIEEKMAKIRVKEYKRKSESKGRMVEVEDDVVIIVG